MATILIVDDDRFTRSVLQTALERDPALQALDVSIHTADNGRQALDEHRRLQADAMIVDLLMPQMDGFTLCRTIRDMPDGDRVHIICMSGIYRDPSVIQRVKDEYRAEFFAKPYQLRDLTQHLVMLLEMDARGEDSRAVRIAAPLPSQPRSGDLSKRPLPAVLLDLLDEQATGRLHLQRGGIRKSVELLVGHPRAVASNARDETLGHFLVAYSVLDESAVKSAVKSAAERKQNLADVIVSRGLMTPEDMVQRLTMLTSYRLMQSLRWPDGAWRFEPGTPSTGNPGGGNPIDMVALVFQGLALTASVDTVPERVQALERKPLELTERGENLLPAVRQHLSERFADVFKPGITIPGLGDHGVQRTELLTTVEVLLLCDLIRVTSAGAPDDDDTRATHELSVQELSAVLNRRSEQRASAGAGPGSSPSPGPGDLGANLYDSLFDDLNVTAPAAGDIPIALPDEAPDVLDSGQIDITALQERLDTAEPTKEETNLARRILLKEYLRIQGLDHYQLLNVDPKATPQVISAAFEDRKSKLSMDWYGRLDLGKDYAKLEEIHAAYSAAAEVLLDPERRVAYDRKRNADDGQDSEQLTLDAEIAYHAGRDLLEHGSYQGAIEHLQTAIAAAPDEAEYHAVLGWAHYLEGGRTPRAADTARPHLNKGLLINPDHALSHAYKGIISAELGIDEAEAIFHLQRALDADPSCAEALQRLQSLWLERGELRPLERQYRRLIYRTSGNDPELELALWCKLAYLYMDKLGEMANARVAFESAARLAPGDPEIGAALRQLGSGIADQFIHEVDDLRKRWSASPMRPEPGLELMRLARDSGRPDPAYMAASALVARNWTDNEALELYQRHRPRFIMRAYRPLDETAWEFLRCTEDLAELNDLFALLSPAIEASFPFDETELEVDVATMEVPEDVLPEPFVRVREYVAHMLGVPVPRVIAKPEYGHQIHVAALSPPALLAGDDVITSPERLELAFRLGRAMTYLLPGRTFAGSRPGRFLKAAVLAVFSAANPRVPIDDGEGHVALIRSNLRAIPAQARAEATHLVEGITKKSPSLNLTLWSQALARTATRFGFVLCGDLPQAVRFARDSSTPAVIDDLIDFAVSQACWSLRSHLGLSIDV